MGVETNEILLRGLSMPHSPRWYRGKLQSSVVSGNTITAPYGYGAGIYNYGDLTIQNSTISGNKLSGPGGGYGGGIYNYGTYGAGGVLVIENSTISGNSVASGLSSFGGGVANYGGSVTIRNSTVSGNKIGGAFGAGGGITSVNYGALTIENSTVSGNKATSTYAAGGAIASDHDTLTITNSTISTNTARSAGGGVATYYALATIENATITGNKVSDRDGAGGGILNIGDLTLNRSLVSGNKATSGAEVYNYTYGGGGGTVTTDHDLFGAKGIAGVEGFAPGGTDIVPNATFTVQKILGPLATNNGTTKTHALKPGSPAIDAVPSTDPACAGTDQRGVTRPQRTGCDIGAFELQ